jgi:benzoyl-CoA reductase subunit C
MLPIGVIGAGNRLEIAHADSRFQSFICSIVKSTLELGLTGKLDFLDGIVFHSICDPARNLGSVFKRNFPGLMVEYIHFPQNMTSPHTIDYLVAEYKRLSACYEQLSGNKITDEALRQSIALYNEQRRLVRELYAIRRETPQNLSTVECYGLTRVGTLLSPEEHIAILREALPELRRRNEKPKDRIKVVLEGSFCEQPPIELLDGLESAGCYILDDDFLIGWRWFSGDIPAEGNPLRDIANAYLNRSVYSGVKHDTREPKAKHLIDKFKATGATAVLILAAKFCEPALFDYALYKRALEKEGIPHLCLEFEEKMWIFDKARTEVETFVESMLFD